MELIKPKHSNQVLSYQYTLLHRYELRVHLALEAHLLCSLAD